MLKQLTCIFEQVNLSAQGATLTNSNFQTAVDLWFSDQASAISTYGHIKDWDVSGVTSMANAFKDRTDFNENITGWDVSSVTNMANMFRNASSFKQPIGDWDVSSVTSMVGMFKNCVQFNSDISGWNTDSVTEMDEMYSGASIFNYTIKTWDKFSESVNAEVNLFFNAYRFLAGHNCSQSNAVPNQCYSLHELYWYRAYIDILPQPTSMVCDDGQTNAYYSCAPKSCTVPPAESMPANVNSSSVTCAGYSLADGETCKPSCLTGYILVSADGTKYEGKFEFGKQNGYGLYQNTYRHYQNGARQRSGCDIVDGQISLASCMNVYEKADKEAEKARMAEQKAKKIAMKALKLSDAGLESNAAPAYFAYYDSSKFF